MLCALTILTRNMANLNFMNHCRDMKRILILILDGCRHLTAVIFGIYEVEKARDMLKMFYDVYHSYIHAVID